MTVLPPPAASGSATCSSIGGSGTGRWRSASCSRCSSSPPWASASARSCPARTVSRSAACRTSTGWGPGCSRRWRCRRRLRVDLPDHEQDHVGPELRGDALDPGEHPEHRASASCSGSRSASGPWRRSSWSCSRSSASSAPRWRCWRPVAILIGLAFSSCLIAFTATQKNDVGFSAVFRFVINPLFLFSGTFFPLAQLPDPIEWVAWLTPLFHGVELVRGSMLDQLDSVDRADSPRLPAGHARPSASSWPTATCATDGGLSR